MESTRAWTTALGHMRWDVQCTIRQVRGLIRGLSRLVTSTATIRSTATVPRPTHSGS